MDAKKQLTETNPGTIENAHKASMADIAAGTSHNIGNILNSVKTSAQLIGNTMTESAATSFCKANELLRENIDHHSVAIEKASANYPGFPFKSPNGFIFWSISGTTPRKRY